MSDDITRVPRKFKHKAQRRERQIKDLKAAVITILVVIGFLAFIGGVQIYVCKKPHWQDCLIERWEK